MICPKDNLECAKPQVCNAGRLCAPPPDMVEIERLVDVLITECRKRDGYVLSVRAALMAAILKLAEKKDA